MSAGSPDAVPLEREVKLAAAAEFEVPPLDGVVAGLHAVAAPPQVLDARYWDTADLRLIRSGVSLRHRTRDGGSGTWTVKVPAGGGVPTTGALVRTEVDMPGPGGRPPADAARLVAAHSRNAELVPAARLFTTRTTMALEFEGRPVGELADDLVEVLEGDEVMVRFREIEIEVGPTVSDEALDALVGALRAAGAGAPDPTPKIARALGPRALAPPDLQPRPRGRARAAGGREPTAGEALSVAIGDAVARIVASHHVACASGDPDAVRAIRTAVRRARNVLGVAAPLVDDEWSAVLRPELRWVGEQLSDVRRLDGRVRRVARAARHLDRSDDRAAVSDLLDRLAVARAAAWDDAVAALGSARYRAVLEHLVMASTALPATSRADRDAAAEGRRLVRPQWRRLRHAVGHVDDADDGRGPAIVRTLARRVRVGADLVVAVDGPHGSVRLAAALGDVGDALGARHEALDAAAWLRSVSLDVPPAAAMVAGQLVAHEERAGARADARWRRAWDRADRPKATRWLE